MPRPHNFINKLRSKRLLPFRHSFMRAMPEYLPESRSPLRTGHATILRYVAALALRPTILRVRNASGSDSRSQYPRAKRAPCTDGEPHTTQGPEPSPPSTSLMSAPVSSFIVSSHLSFPHQRARTNPPADMRETRDS